MAVISTEINGKNILNETKRGLIDVQNKAWHTKFIPAYSNKRHRQTDEIVIMNDP